MNKISIGIMVMILPLIFLFQNCGKSSGGAGNGGNSEVNADEMTVDVEDENAADSTNPPPTGTVQSVDFGYDAAAAGYKYSLVFASSKVFNAQDEEVKTLTNAELSVIVNIIAKNRLLQGRTDAECASDEIAVPIYGRLNLPEDQGFTLNQAKANCGRIDFVDANNNAVDFASVLAEIEAELETP